MTPDKIITPDFQPGFRLNTMDIVVLLLGMMSAYIASGTSWQITLIITFTIGHFFLFCNVFRISKSTEMTWAGFFLGMASLTILTRMPGWWATITASLLLTLLLVIQEMKKPSYHGILWESINPQLKVWWEREKGKIKGSE